MFNHEFEPDFRGFGHFDGGRMGRGTMEPVILRALLEKPMHGYEIISTLEEQSHGMWRPSPGSVYPTLQLLEEKGHVTATETDGKKIYQLTDEGRKAAEQAEPPLERWGSHQRPSMQEMKAMRETLHDVMRDMRTIHRRGNDLQKQRMSDAIEHLRGELRHITEERL